MANPVKANESTVVVILCCHCFSACHHLVLSMVFVMFVGMKNTGPSPMRLNIHSPSFVKHIRISEYTQVHVKTVPLH